MENIINRIKNKYKEHSYRNHTTKSIISAAQTSTNDIQCKEVAFHHAGYDPDFRNTIMFRLEGSTCYGGGVRGSAVRMILFVLIGEEAIRTVQIGMERGKALFTMHSDMILSKSDYYVHCTGPGNPNDHLYQFPLAPSFKVWSIPDSVPSIWARDSNKSLVDTRSKLEMNKPTGPELRALCNKSVIARDKHCVISGAKATDCERAFIIPVGEDIFWKTEMLSSHMGDMSF
jgi:hypothetical protein